MKYYPTVDTWTQTYRIPLAKIKIDVLRSFEREIIERSGLLTECNSTVIRNPLSNVTLGTMNSGNPTLTPCNRMAAHLLKILNITHNGRMYIVKLTTALHSLIPKQNHQC